MARATLLLAGLGGCGPAPIESVTIGAGKLASGLVAHWSFDEPSGATTVRDRSGNGRDGLLTGGSWMPGRFAGGLHLEAGDSVTISNFPQAAAEWTVSVWIRLTAADVQAFATEERAVLLSAERAGVGGWEIEFDPRPGSNWLEASYYAGPPTDDYIAPRCRCIETDRWLQWTAVFDSPNGRFSLFHNGLLADAASIPAPGTILTGDSTLYIGRWNQAGRFLSGLIDDFAIWQRALSVDEVALLNVRPVPDSL